MSAVRYVLLVTLLLPACGDDGDATPSDGSMNDAFDNGSCGDQVRLTGELVDLDSSGAAFCGVFEATLEVAGDGATDITAPNGRYDLCTPDAATTQLSITFDPASSPCTVPPSPYTTPAVLFARKDVILSGAFYSARGITDARKAGFYTDVVGAPFDATKGHVLVHVHGTPRAVSLVATHGTTLANTTGTWAAGSTGVDVLFPNVDVGGGTTMLSVAGGAVGTGSVPVIAGTITNVTVNAR